VILRSQITSCLDYEGELGTVMSRRASRVAARDAMSHVGGYTIINDISARDLQGAEPQWLRAKSLDSFAPVGPYVVDPRSAGPVEQMRIQTLVNGELRQDASCAAMIVGVPDLIEYVTEAITLEPGDLIATGTPAGVAAEGDPPVFLAHGDVVEVEITGLGRLRNQVQAR
jgi:2-keto-4-pentenoate hydratase/2-oxohepta-3-ene-1,7-dioic acid hydratase in catechol pathway